MIAAILNMSFTASFMIIIIALFRRCFMHKMPKKSFLILWGVVICRLLIPFTIPSNFSAYMLLPSIEDVSAIQENTNLAANTERFTHFVINTSKTAQNILSNDGFSVSPIFIIWVLGLTVCIFFFLFTHLRFRIEYNTSLPAENVFIYEWIKKHRTLRNIQVRQSDKIFTPLTYGIFKPIILLPKNLDYSDTDKMQYILMHEFTHIKRLDTLTKWLLATALCVHWFNPLVWMMYNLANRDIELSCDETVVHTFGELRKSDYAITLISMEEKISKITPLCNNFSKHAIEERIQSIMKFKRRTIFTTFAAVIVIIGITTAFATSAATKNVSNADSDSMFTKKEQAILSALQFDGYKDMSVADYKVKADARIDEEGWMGDLEHMFQNQSIKEIRYTNDKSSFLNNTLFPLIGENWAKIEFGNYVKSPHSALGDGGILEYKITRTILDSEKVTVREHDKAIQDMVKELQTLVIRRSINELQAEESMNKSIENKIKNLIDKWQTNALQFDISFIYTPLIVFEPIDESKTKQKNQADEYDMVGTSEDFNQLLSLKTSDYQKQSVADFNNSLLVWANKNAEAAERIARAIAMNKINADLTKEEKSFLNVTYPISNAQNTIKVKFENYGDPLTDPILLFQLTAKEDPYTWLEYSISIHIKDYNKLTIGERDQYVSHVINGMQDFWNKKNIGELADIKEEVFHTYLTKLIGENKNKLIQIKAVDLGFNPPSK